MSGPEAFAEKFPGWHAWRGVGDTGWYARRERSSPPIVINADSPDELVAKVKEYLTKERH